jgi:hypothetical protein
METVLIGAALVALLVVAAWFAMVVLALLPWAFRRTMR